MLTSKSQVLFQENFTPPYQTGWIVQNLSASPNPTLTWFAPTASLTFNSYNGAPNDYIAANFNNTTDQNNAVTLSDWLITPTLNLQNGVVVSFATRTSTNPNQYADRLEVRMSTAGTGSNVGSTPTSLGTFTDVLTTINPNLTSTGYPGVWTVYNLTVSGVPTPTVGRVAFRYFVTNGGPAGANSDYIGLDAVTITAPACAATVQSYTVCTGNSATLTANGAAAGSTYSWLPGGQTTPSIVVTPGSTTTYTLQYTEPSGVCPAKTATVTVGNTLNVQISSTSPSVCSGGSATLTATGASQYGWLPGPVLGSSLVVSPSAMSVYTVGGTAGTCTGSATYTLGVYPNPTVSVSGNTLVCTTGPNASATFTSNGASTYMWAAGTSTAAGNEFTLNITSPSAPTMYTVGVMGTDANGCTDSETATVTAAPKPVVTVTSSHTVACTNSSYTLSASGAGAYSWSGGGSGGNLTVNTGSTAGTVNHTVTGTTAGCAGTAVHSQSVIVCTTTVGIAETGYYLETSIFPNPFSNEIRINALDGTVIVYNALGQEVINQPVGTSVSINTQNLPKGAYIVKAFNFNGEVVKTVKLVKN